MDRIFRLRQAATHLPSLQRGCAGIAGPAAPAGARRAAGRVPHPAAGAAPRWPGPSGSRSGSSLQCRAAQSSGHAWLGAALAHLRRQRGAPRPATVPLSRPAGPMPSTKSVTLPWPPPWHGPPASSPLHPQQPGLWLPQPPSDEPSTAKQPLDALGPAGRGPPCTWSIQPTRHGPLQGLLQPQRKAVTQVQVCPQHEQEPLGPQVAVCCLRGCHTGAEQPGRARYEPLRGGSPARCVHGPRRRAAREELLKRAAVS